MTESSSQVARWVDTCAIQDLVCRERHWRDREDWDRMRACYTNDAYVKVTWFSGSIDAYVEDSRQPGWDPTAISKHRMSPPLVKLNGDRALAETSVLLELRLAGGAVAFDASISVRLLSRVQRTPDGWKLASMDAIYEKDSFRPVFSADTLPITAQDTASFRRSYQFLAHGAAGQLPDDIPGDDRPGLVHKLYQTANAWLTHAA